MAAHNHSRTAGLQLPHIALRLTLPPAALATDSGKPDPQGGNVVAHFFRSRCRGHLFTGRT